MGCYFCHQANGTTKPYRKCLLFLLSYSKQSWFLNQLQVKLYTWSFQTSLVYFLEQTLHFLGFQPVNFKIGNEPLGVGM